MTFVHRISLRATAAQQRELEALGVRVPAGVVLPGGGAPHVAFDVDEDHPNWSTLQRLFRQWDTGDLVSTKFSKREIESAPWLALVPDWHCGYPQPNADEFGYREATYDLAHYCERCGVGLKQHAPFQMNSEPKWGRKGILQLNWVFDEYFVTPEVWQGVFMPHGIESRPVLNTKGAELKTVVQLVAQQEVGIVTDGLPTEEAVCSKCGQVKYLPVTRGPFPALTSEPSRAMVKTKEYFGNGASAHKRVLVSQALGRAVTAAKVQGASLWPVAQDNGAGGAIS